MTRSYRKNTLRTFKSTASRFAAVFAIVALGVGFLAAERHAHRYERVDGTLYG